MLFAKFKTDGSIVSKSGAYFADDHCCIFRVGHIDSVLFDKFGIFCRSIAGKGRYAVGIVDRLKNIRNLVNGNAAWDSIDDVLQLGSFFL